MKSNKERPKSARSSVAAGKRKLTAVKSEEVEEERKRQDGLVPNAVIPRMSSAEAHMGTDHMEQAAQH